MRITTRGLFLAGALAACACQPMAWPDTRVGINRPPEGSVALLQWDPIPGASAYQVSVYSDRAGTLPVGAAGFTAEPHLSLSALAWQEGHPIAGRPYFWLVRAYDRPDPRGLLLTTRGPNELELDEAWTGFVSPPPSLSPSPMPSAGLPSASP